MQFIKYQNLVRLAAEADAVINLEQRPGHFVVRGHRFATVWPPEAAPLVRPGAGTRARRRPVPDPEPGRVVWHRPAGRDCLSGCFPQRSTTRSPR